MVRHSQTGFLQGHNAEALYALIPEDAKRTIDAFLETMPDDSEHLAVAAPEANAEFVPPPPPSIDDEADAPGAAEDAAAAEDDAGAGCSRLKRALQPS